MAKKAIGTVVKTVEVPDSFLPYMMYLANNKPHLATLFSKFWNMCDANDRKKFFELFK